jgi:hypothetical protein
MSNIILVADAHEIAIGIISGLLTIPVIFFLASFIQRLQNHQVKNFWRPFYRQKIKVVLTEHAVPGQDVSDPFSVAARKAGGGYLVSRGSALAMAALLQFLSVVVTKRHDIDVIGDKSSRQSSGDDGHILVLGSPATNIYTQSIFRSLGQRFDFPYIVTHDERTGTIEFEAGDGSFKLTPSIDSEGNGTDYAMVIRAEYGDTPPRYAIIIAGAYMYGNEAAARAVLNPSILREVERQTKNASNVTFLLKTEVIQGYPGRPLLRCDDNDGQHIQALAMRRWKGK